MAALLSLIPSVLVGQYLHVRLGESASPADDARRLHAAAVAAWGAEMCRADYVIKTLTLTRAPACR